MAKVKFGSLATDARGSMGGMTFTKNRYGAVARTKVSPVQPRTALQTQRRNLFTVLSKAWRALSPIQRAAWNTWAASNPISDVFGDSKILSGNAAFQRVANVMILCGLAQPTVPPIPTTLTPTAALSAVSAAGAGTITVTTAAQTVSTGFYIGWTPGGMSQGKTVCQSLIRVCGVLTPVGAATTLVFSPATYNPRLGFTVGQKVPVFIERYCIEGNYLDVVRFDTTAAA